MSTWKIPCRLEVSHSFFHPLGYDLLPALQACQTYQEPAVQNTWQYPVHLQLSTYPNHTQQPLALTLWVIAMK